MTTKHAGADWIQNYLLLHKDAAMSELGKNVADLLGELFGGIYHLDPKSLMRTDWSNNHYIEFSLGHKDLSTVDFNELTTLVFLAHHMAIRVNIEGSKKNYLRLLFHQRRRTGNYSKKHPTIDQAVETFKQNVSIPEYVEEL